MNLTEKKEAINSNFSDKDVKRNQEGKLNALERILLLLDESSFQEIGMFRKDNSQKSIEREGVITGYGTIYGRPVCVFSQDFRFLGGSVGNIHADKIVKLQQFAIRSKMPIIGIQDSGGARIQESVDALAGYGNIFQNNVNASGVIPQISVIMGPCAGGAVYSPSLTDFVFMCGENSYMFITGPDVIKKTTNETVSMQQLGGYVVHSEISGVSDFFIHHEYDCLRAVRKLITFIPQSFDGNVPYTHDRDENKTIEEIEAMVPKNPNESYDVKSIISSIVDYGDFFEVGADFAKNIVVCFARIDGKAVGIVANQPKELSGSLDINSSRKAARFIRFCNAFKIPIVTLVDVPGFLPGVDQEHNGIIKHGAKLLYAYAEATVPKITIITRKAYGGAYIVMGSKHLGGDLNYAWPNAEIAVLGAEAAINITQRNLSEQEKNIAIENYKNNFLNPYYAANNGHIDDVIEPTATRQNIIKGLRILEGKDAKNIQKRHGNMPL